MELNHKLTYVKTRQGAMPVYVTVNCEEPIGFDNFKTKMSRGEYHGISAELSMDSIEFHNKEAIDLILEAYHNGIDNVVIYSVSNSDNVEVFRGVIDLTTLMVNESEYRSVSVMVGDVGTKTTFNNRSSYAVDLGTDKTLDGTELEDIPVWKEMKIPMKHLLYTNLLEQNYEKTYKKGVGGENPHDEGVYIGSVLNDVGCIIIPFSSNSANEFGEISQLDTVYSIIQKGDGSNIPFLYTPGEEHNSQYGSGTIVNINARLNISISPKTYNGGGASGGSVSFRIIAENNFGDSIVGDRKYVSRATFSGLQNFELQLNLEGSIPADKAIKLYILTSVDGGVYYSDVWVTIKPGSYVKMTMYDNIVDEGTPVKMLPIHEALNTIVEVISENELTVRSDWYGRLDSIVNPTTKTGGGAYKALTNGYRIRGLFSEGVIHRNMPLSFKDIIESLDAIDCIGWCFGSDSVGDFIRIEPWEWFYKDEDILSINDVKITREFNADDVITELIIGYKKYATSDDYNSIDSIHGERTFVSNIKGVSKSISKLCDFIADNYAIEETRRAAYKVASTEEFKYDENIFVIEFADLNSGQFRNFIPRGVIEGTSTGIAKPGELINMSISPFRNACRWANRLKSSYGKTVFKLSSGTINYSASYEKGWNVKDTHLSSIGGLHAENEDIPISEMKFVSEKISFDHPLSVSQYNAIKSNPYGLISVNGIRCWIKEFIYSFVDGMANFVLIPKIE